MESKKHATTAIIYTSLTIILTIIPRSTSVTVAPINTESIKHRESVHKEIIKFEYSDNQPASQNNVYEPSNNSNDKRRVIEITKNKHFVVPIVRRVEVPVPQPYAIPVPKHYPVAVPQPYAVEVARPVAVPVPHPYPVRVPVAYPVPVPRHIPVAVPQPYAVHVTRNVPIPVPQPYAVQVPVAHPVPVYQESQSDDYNEEQRDTSDSNRVNKYDLYGYPNDYNYKS